jgi:hypothetical protein
MQLQEYECRMYLSSVIFTQHTTFLSAVVANHSDLRPIVLSSIFELSELSITEQAMRESPIVCELSKRFVALYISFEEKLIVVKRLVEKSLGDSIT